MIEINNLTPVLIDKRFLEKVIKGVLRAENKEKADLSIAFLGPVKIKGLNRKYLKKNKATDVLSFPGDDRELGEIIICPQQVKKNAKKYNLSFKKELAQVLIHGILHLLGYKHENSLKEAKIMEKRQQHYKELCQK